MRNLLVAQLALAAWTSAAATSATALHALDEATGAALQADASRAIELLERVPAAEFDGTEASVRDCMLKRFENPAPAPVAEPDPFARTLLETYRRYWHRALRDPAGRERAERELVESLRTLLNAKPDADLEQLWPAVERKLGESGLHVLGGRTGRLLELMLWRREDAIDHHVRLPEQVQDVRVMQLDGFVSFGWSHYATCGRRATGGWAHPDRLFAVMPRYAGGAEGEQFRVSLLGHEAQHAADKSRFPGLASWELEYRAKLTELALADGTRSQILARFTEDQGDDVRSPHSYANKRVLAAVRKQLALSDDAQLAAVPTGKLQQAAAALLRADTAARLR